MDTKTEIPKILIGTHAAIDVVYDLNTFSSLNQAMLKLMKSEVLIRECNKRIDTKKEYKKSFGGMIYFTSKIQKEIDFMYEVLQRIENYRYEKMIKVSDLIKESLPIDYKF